MDEKIEKLRQQAARLRQLQEEKNADMQSYQDQIRVQQEIAFTNPEKASKRLGNLANRLNPDQFRDSVSNRLYASGVALKGYDLGIVKTGQRRQAEIAAQKMADLNEKLKEAEREATAAKDAAEKLEKQVSSAEPIPAKDKRKQLEEQQLEEMARDLEEDPTIWEHDAPDPTPETIKRQKKKAEFDKALRRSIEKRRQRRQQELEVKKKKEHEQEPER